ncbi:MAG: hypothetical protein COT74_11130 [Bdellovibrionales bacterium CG10_big_fil_rev_8_21_14_0_10_45_34]|nr:MAG: hypothetical protein COT74_11130 [Bdellovibrionales bacterium CG10_big_fil_rev_8_21_14_0_10_45_34]
MQEETKRIYYSKSEVVDIYDWKRFQRLGGRYVAKKENSALEELLTLAKIDSASLILDCPVGTGRFIPNLKKFSNNIIAADISPSMIEVAKSYGASEYLVCSADQLPLANETIDLWVMSRFCFHFEDLSVFFKEASRVLKKNGHLIFDAFNWSPRSLVPSPFLGGKTFNHPPAELNKILGVHGFEIVKRLPTFFIPTYISTFIPNFLVEGVERISDQVAPLAKTKSFYLVKKVE